MAGPALILSRRQALALVVGAAVEVGVASSCRPPQRASLDAGTATATAPAAVRTGGTLVYGQSVAISNTLPYPSSSSNNLFKWALFNPLVSLDERRQPVGVLAESWSLSDDRLTLTFKLRQGVKFHSGRPFTADEAMWSIQYAQDPKNAAQSGAELEPVQVRAKDAATLELKLPDVMPHVFSLLTDVMMLDPQSDIIHSAAGTGAFRLDALTPGVEMRLVRNPQYWRTDRPYLDGVTITNVSDLSSGVINLESGAVGIIGVRLSDVAQLKSQDGLEIVLIPSTGNYEFLVNTVAPPFSDKRVRQAIDLALDRKRFSQTLLYGVADPTYIMWPKSSPVWDASIDVGEFNLDKARQLLASAGYPDGFETKIQAATVYSEEVQFDQVVQADLATIGINAAIEPLDSASATSALAQGSFSALFSYAYAYADADPAMAFTSFPFRPHNNASHFQSDEYSMMVDAARREPDPTKRIALYRGIATYLKDQAFVLPLANSTVALAMRANVHGFIRQPLFTVPVLEEIWLA